MYASFFVAKSLEFILIHKSKYLWPAIPDQLFAKFAVRKLYELNFRLEPLTILIKSSAKRLPNLVPWPIENQKLRVFAFSLVHNLKDLFDVIDRRWPTDKPSLHIQRYFCARIDKPSDGQLQSICIH